MFGGEERACAAGLNGSERLRVAGSGEPKAARVRRRAWPLQKRARRRMQTTRRSGKDPMEHILAIAVSVAVGLVVGVLSGLLGIGGGAVLIPVFKLGYAMDAIAATATSLFTIIPTSVSGLITHMRAKTCLPKLGVAMGLGGALTSPLGVWLATKSPSWLIVVVAALVIGYSGYSMFRKALACPPSGKRAASKAGCSADEAASEKTGERVESADAQPAAGLGEPSSHQPAPPAFTLTRDHLAKGVCIGLVTGVASGYVGLGGGFIMVPLMMKLLHTPMKLTAGTSLIAVMILAVPSAVYQGFLGNIDWLTGISIAAGSIPGAVLGAHLSARVPERQLRFLFSVFLFVAAVLLVANQFGLAG